ncbi:MAG: PepSY domain-containing protein [Sphingomonadaceae bacterium]|nr:PepSY domain-containing protein [Sphingomonadaceae bacterium]
MRIYSTLILVGAASLALSSAPAAATGAIKCKAGPVSSWKSQDVLKAKLVKEGWTVRKSKVDGGCYEVYGTTPEGDRVEAYFHPVTLEKLYVARRGEVLFRKAGY